MNQPAPQGNQGFAVIPNWLARDPSVTPNAKAMFAILGSHTGRDGTWQMPMRQLAEEMGASPATARRAVQELQSLGVLDVHVSEDPEEAMKGNHYRVRMYLPAADPLPTVGAPPYHPWEAPPTTSERGEEEPLEEPSPPPPSGEAPPTPHGASKLPAGWQPTEKHSQYAYAHGISIKAEVDNFRTYYLDGTGATKRHKDWDRAFTNWMRLSVQRLQENGKFRPRPRLQAVHTPPAPSDEIVGGWWGSAPREEES